MVAETRRDTHSPSAGLSWAASLKRVFAFDVLVCSCGGGRRRIVGVYTGGHRSRHGKAAEARSTSAPSRWSQH